MPKQAKISRTLIAVLAATLAVAVALCAVLVYRHQEMNRRLAQLQAELTASTAAWNATSAAKEILLGQLKEVNGSIREAELTITESEAKAEQITGQLETLTAADGEARGRQAMDLAMTRSLRLTAKEWRATAGQLADAKTQLASALASGEPEALRAAVSAAEGALNAMASLRERVDAMLPQESGAEEAPKE